MRTVDDDEKNCYCNFTATGDLPYSRFYSDKLHFLFCIFEQADEAGVGMPYSDEETRK